MRTALAARSTVRPAHAGEVFRPPLRPARALAGCGRCAERGRLANRRWGSASARAGVARAYRTLARCEGWETRFLVAPLAPAQFPRGEEADPSPLTARGFHRGGHPERNNALHAPSASQRSRHTLWKALKTAPTSTTSLRTLAIGGSERYTVARVGRSMRAAPRCGCERQQGRAAPVGSRADGFSASASNPARSTSPGGRRGLVRSRGDSATISRRRAERWSSGPTQPLFATRAPHRVSAQHNAHSDVKYQRSTPTRRPRHQRVRSKAGAAPSNVARRQALRARPTIAVVCTGRPHVVSCSMRAEVSIR